MFQKVAPKKGLFYWKKGDVTLKMKINPFKLERLAAKYEFSSKYSLSLTDSESIAMKELLDLEPSSHDGFHALSLGYTEPLGLPSLREQISALYQNMGADNIMAHVGAGESMFLFMNTALTAGDHVIVQVPCYQSLIELPRAIGCEITEWVADEQNVWEFDITFLEKHIKKNTKAIIINVPHNPTGNLMSREKFEQIIDIARSYNCLVYSDEVFRFLEYDDADRLPSACDLYENAVSSGGLAKSFGLAGLRIGWIATKNKKIYDAMASYRDYTTIGNSAPSEYLAGVALRHKDILLERNKTIAQKNLLLLKKFFTKYDDIFNWYLPKTSTIMFPSFKEDINVEKFSEELVTKKGVYLIPSTVFDYGNKNFRIGYGRKNFPDALKVFEEFIIEKFRS